MRASLLYNSHRKGKSMSDKLKEIFQRELEELKQNKIRAIALGVCFVVVLIVWAIDDGSSGDEIVLDDKPPVTKDLPVKVLPVEKSPDGVTVVLGANADALYIGDPFAVEEKPKPPPKPEPPPPLPVIPAPSIVIQPPEPPTPRETLTLTGTAISGDNKTAMILRGNETLFVTTGEEIDGRRIVDITPEFVTFDDGERIFLQKGLD